MRVRDAEDALVEFIVDSLADWPAAGGEAVHVRRMFGGRCVYCGEVAFGLIAAGELYLKVDAGNALEFVARGLEPFRFESSRGVTEMSYRRAPLEAVERPAALRRWADSALAAARRNFRPRKRRPR